MFRKLTLEGLERRNLLANLTYTFEGADYEGSASITGVDKLPTITSGSLAFTDGDRTIYIGGDQPDINKDGKVSLDDLVQMVAELRSGQSVSDANLDGRSDAADLLAIVAPLRDAIFAGHSGEIHTAEADVAVDWQVTPLVSNDKAQFTALVVNKGPDTARRVALSFTIGSQQVSMPTFSLLKGGTAFFNLTVDVDEDQDGEVIAAVEADPSTFDPDESNNGGEIPVTII
jgi:hypothetical protein